MNKKLSAPIEEFLKRNRSGRFWGYLSLLTITLCLILCWRMADAFAKRPRFIVLDPAGTMIITSETSFQDARQLHIAQAELAVQTLLNRHPGGFDSPERLRRLFDRTSYARALELEKSEAAEFAGKSLRQKVEIAGIDLQKLGGTAVEVAVEGQLIRAGVFKSRPSVEVMLFDLRMRFEHNPSLLENGRFPTVVRSFELTTTPL